MRFNVGDYIEFIEDNFNMNADKRVIIESNERWFRYKNLSDNCEYEEPHEYEVFIIVSKHNNFLKNFQ